MPEPICGSHHGQNGDGGDASDYETIRLADQLYLHTNHAPHFMASRVDIFIRDRLQPQQNTRLALLSRVLERGTKALPTMRAINQFADGLFGAAYGSGVDQFGDVQALHLGLEVLDSVFLPDRSEDLLRPGLELLHDVLFHPYSNADEDGFPRLMVEREKRALDRQISNLMNDKSAYAQRRCVEAMCRGEAYGLSALGDSQDLPALDGPQLWSCHNQLLTTRPMDIFFSSRQQVDDSTIAQFERHFASHKRHVDSTALAAAGVSATPSATREITEVEEVSQGRLVLGLRTPVDLCDAAYPALVVLNQLLGSDGHSRLHQTVREEAGLCYYIGSFLEPLCGLMFIEAGIDVHDYDEARGRIEGECRALAEDGPESGELARAKAQLTQHLRSLIDDREALMRFYLARRISQTEPGRDVMLRHINAVSPDDVREAARGLRLDTVYFLTSVSEGQ